MKLNVVLIKEKQKPIYFFEKQIQNGQLKKKGHFSKSPILNILLSKFHELVLGLVGLNDAKGIEMAQPIWSSGCLT